MILLFRNLLKPMPLRTPSLCCYEWLPYSTFPKGASTGKHRMHPPPSAVHFFPLCPFQSIVVLQDEGTCKKLKEGGGRGGTSNITHTYDSWFARENTEYNSWGTETSTTKVRAKATMAGNENRNKNRELLFFFFDNKFSMPQSKKEALPCYGLDIFDCFGFNVIRLNIF